VVEPLIDRDELEHQLARFRGSILQSPPPVSAKKVGGTRAYKLARAQVAVELPPVPVEIFELTLLRIHGSEVALRAHCSGGTYMRSIAHDLGQALGCGAHLSELRRAASGEFRIEQAHTPAELEVLVSEGRLAEVLIPAAQLLPHFPSVYAEPQIITHIRQGRNFPVSPFRTQPGSRYIKAISREGELIAIGEAKLPNLYHPVVVM
jgi:tRNA pseudouridine55 synthase